MSNKAVEASSASAPYSFWLRHPTYDANINEVNRWYNWMQSGQPPRPPCPPPTNLQTAAVYLQCIGAVVAPALQWRYARSGACVKPSAALTALSCIPAVFVGFNLSASLSLPLVDMYNKSLSRSHPPVKAEDDPMNYIDQAYLVHIGHLSWPLPLRDEKDCQVPDWVDHYPHDTQSEHSPHRLHWLYYMAEHWRYTAEDVAVRSRVLDSKLWCHLLPWGAGTALYGAAVWAWQRRRPPSSRLLFGFVATAAFIPFIVA